MGLTFYFILIVVIFSHLSTVSVCSVTLKTKIKRGSNNKGELGYLSSSSSLRGFQLQDTECQLKINIRLLEDYIHWRVVF